MLARDKRYSPGAPDPLWCNLTATTGAFSGRLDRTMSVQALGLHTLASGPTHSARPRGPGRALFVPILTSPRVAGLCSKVDGNPEPPYTLASNRGGMLALYRFSTPTDRNLEPRPRTRRNQTPLKMLSLWGGCYHSEGRV